MDYYVKCLENVLEMLTIRTVVTYSFLSKDIARFSVNEKRADCELKPFLHLLKKGTKKFN